MQPAITSLVEFGLASAGASTLSFDEEMKIFAYFGIGISLLSMSRADESEKMTPVPAVESPAKDVLDVMGVSICSMVLKFERGKNFQINVYAKLKGKNPKLLIEGPIVRNDDGALDKNHRVVMTIDGLHVEPRQKQLKIGLGLFD